MAIFKLTNGFANCHKTLGRKTVAVRNHIIQTEDADVIAACKKAGYEELKEAPVAKVAPKGGAQKAVAGVLSAGKLAGLKAESNSK